MVAARGPQLSRHERQEAEANQFAIELLAPPALVRQYTRRLPDLSAVLDMAAGLQISKEAAARRYVELHRKCLAIVFSKSGLATYFSAGADFPSIALRKNDKLPVSLKDIGAGHMTSFDIADPLDWLNRPKRQELAAQTLVQQNGHAMTLLHAEAAEDSEDEGEAGGRSLNW